MRFMRALRAGITIVTLVTGNMVPATSVQAQQVIVSTSGIPHGDVANLRLSPYWREGMPRGANRAWRDYLRTTVGRITADADVVLHTGDQVEGRWYADVQRTGVLGPRTTWRQKVRYVHTAGDVYYSWYRQFWEGHDVLWGIGDHEIGDIGPDGVMEPSRFKYKAHWHWNEVWKDWHGGRTRYAARRGEIGIITLDPFQRVDRGVVARIDPAHFDWIEARVRDLRASGARWIIVQSEIPALGPNAGSGTSGLILENGDRLWNTLEALDVDLLLAAEFHEDTTYTDDGRTPMQVVHGGSTRRVSWITIDVAVDRLVIDWYAFPIVPEGSGEIWASTWQRLNNRPVAGSVTRIGSMTVSSDGRVTQRSGEGREDRFSPFR